MSFPCGYCAARPDVACRHRPADPDYVPVERRVKPKPDTRVLHSGGGCYRVLKRPRTTQTT